MIAPLVQSRRHPLLIHRSNFSRICGSWLTRDEKREWLVPCIPSELFLPGMPSHARLVRQTSPRGCTGKPLHMDNQPLAHAHTTSKLSKSQQQQQHTHTQTPTAPTSRLPFFLDHAHGLRVLYYKRQAPFCFPSDLSEPSRPHLPPPTTTKRLFPCIRCPAITTSCRALPDSRVWLAAAAANEAVTRALRSLSGVRFYLFEMLEATESSAATSSSVNRHPRAPQFSSACRVHIDAFHLYLRQRQSANA